MKDLIHEAIMELREAQCSNEKDGHINTAVKLLTRAMELVKQDDEKKSEEDIALSQAIGYGDAKVTGERDGN